MRGRWKRVPAAALVLALAACQSPPPMRDSLHWYRNAAEAHAAYLQTWETAAGALRAQVRDLPRGSWGIILDVDETLLDNSDYTVEYGPYTERTWDAWTARRAARALPGARAFVTLVREELGGQVALVTNRHQKACPDTEANLHSEGIGYDRILCMADTPDKNPRFAEVQARFRVLMWFGDNIEDFPELSQQEPDLRPFGTRYFVLPNPVYGSWETLPRR